MFSLTRLGVGDADYGPSRYFPFSLMIGVGVQNSLKLFRSLKDKIDLSGGWSNFDVLQFDWAQKLLSKFPFEKEEVLSTMTDLSKGLVEKSATLFSSIVSELPSLTLGVVFTVLSLYFFLNDAERVEKTVRQVSVFKDRETDRLISTFSKMARSVMVASLGSGLIQAVIYSVAYWIAEFGFGRGGASGGFLFVCVFVASFIPVIGSAPITFGLAIYEIFQSGYPVGVTLLIGATLVSVSDNITRPAILRGAADLHPLLGLVSALGGLEAFGFVGMFIGPILAAMVRVAVQILIESRH